MSPITGLSEKKMNKLRAAAEGVVTRADSNGDGKISREEAKAAKRVDTYSTDYTTRISDDYVNRTTIIYDRMATMKDDAFAADADGDGFLKKDELVDAYLKRADKNGDGKLGFWDRFKMSMSGLPDRYERKYDVEISRRTRLEYNPAPSRPTPPSPNDRPTPPSGNDRPTPPSGNDRPTPPSGNDRPTPPSGNDRPTPPSGNDRPTPPSGNNRPTPPGA